MRWGGAERTLGGGFGHLAYGKNYDRLIEIKTKWDPQNIFRVNKNIAPR